MVGAYSPHDKAFMLNYLRMVLKICDTSWPLWRTWTRGFYPKKRPLDLILWNEVKILLKVQREIGQNSSHSHRILVDVWQWITSSSFAEDKNSWSRMMVTSLLLQKIVFVINHMFNAEWAWNAKKGWFWNLIKVQVVTTLLSLVRRELTWYYRGF